MPVQILVLTSHLPFGDLTRLSLETGGSYRVRLCHSPVEALAALQRSPFGVALIDLQTPDPALINFCHVVREIYPNLRIVLFPPNNDPASPRLQEISYHAVLRKPFYLPDLLKEVGNQAEVAGESGIEEASVAWQVLKSSQEGLPGTHDAIVELLLSLLKEPGAAAALVSSGGRLYACASRFSEDVCRELAEATGQIWDSKRREEVARYKRLQTVNGQYLLYAVPLPDDTVLTLAYDESTPMSRARLRAVRLAGQIERAWRPPEAEVAETLPAFDDIPNPNPKPSAHSEQKTQQPVGWVHEADGSALPDGQLLALTESQAPDSEAGQPGAQVYDDAGQAEAGLVTVDEVAQHGSDGQAETVGQVPDALPQPDGPESSKAKTQPVKVVRARVYPTKEEAPGPPEAGQWKPEAASGARLSYSCALIPRLPHHFLTRPLATLLNRWMPQLCEASGWMLEGMTVRPNYFTFTVRLDGECTPDAMVRLVRQHTSEYIFSEYRHLAAENSTGDFWAPQELVTPGTQPLSLAQLSRFMIAARQSNDAPAVTKSDKNSKP